MQLTESFRFSCACYRNRLSLRVHSESGSATVEFIMVTTMLIALTLGVLQLALALHIRNTLIDASSEGARWGSLADSSPSAGVNRTRELITAAVGTDYAEDVTARVVQLAGQPTLQVTARATLPLFGLLGVEKGLEVSGHAPME